MKASFASLILGILFLIVSFIIPKDAIDINFHDKFLMIEHSTILLVIAIILLIISGLLYQKHRVKS
ncbi:hypothetical protein [Pedobacter boryungensis]|uniref:hypothetical protein n=1 Tax=Pedobacter boryungensis TaxID=869962 RepID=UPI001C20A0E0|nr:hypothetical protein [Pedobacter boryungensis]